MGRIIYPKLRQIGNAGDRHVIDGRNIFYPLNLDIEELLGGFDPLSLSPTLWLKADAGLYQDSLFATPATADADPVGGWQDQSGNARHLLQATSTKRPILKLAIQNGRPVIRFDGVDDFMQAAFALVQPEHVFIVYSSRTIGVFAGNDAIFDGVNVASMFLVSETAPRTALYNGFISPSYAGNICNNTFGQITTLFHLAGGGSASYIRENGTSRATGNPGNASAAGGLTLGALGNGTRPTAIDVGEVILFSSVQSAENLALLEAYLKSRWGTP